jgi:hypothetical protein
MSTGNQGWRRVRHGLQPQGAVGLSVEDLGAFAIGGGRGARPPLGLGDDGNIPCFAICIRRKTLLEASIVRK